MEAIFTQKGLENGHANIVIRPEGEDLKGDESIAIGKINTNGTEDYMSRDKGTWTGHKEPINAQKKFENGVLTFRLEPYYVNNLNKQGYTLYLFDGNGDELNANDPVDLWIEGVRKSAISSDGLNLADGEKEAIANAAQEALKQLDHLIAGIEEKITSTKKILVSTYDQSSIVKNALNSADKAGLAQDYSSLQQTVASLAESRTALKSMLDDVHSLVKGSKLTLDPVRAPEANRRAEEIKQKMSELDQQIIQAAQSAESIKQSYEEYDRHQKQIEKARQQQVQEEAERQRLLQEETARQQQLQEEAERQRLLQEETARQQQLQEEAERKRQQQEEAEKLRQRQEEEARQQQLREAATARQQQIQSRRGETNKKGGSGLLVAGIAVAVIAVAALVGVFMLNSSSPVEQPAEQQSPTQTANQDTDREQPAQAVDQQIPKTKQETAAEKPSVKKQVSDFLSSSDKTPQKAMDLAEQLEPKDKDEEDLVFKLYYFAAMRDDERGLIKYAECLDPSKQEWGTITKDPAEAWEYYGKVADGKNYRQSMMTWIEEQAEAGNSKAKKWLKKLK